MAHVPEDEILKFLHRETYVPGVVRVLHSGYPQDREGNPIKQSGPLGGSRRLLRILFAEIGSPLGSCTSVYQFLRVIHDALSAQINMVGGGVLHRNITDQTIQVRDFSWGGTPQVDNYKPEMLIAPYIRELLGEFKPEDNAGQLAECLITDFDDSVLIIKGLYEDEIKKTTGTPMFQSRSVARAALLPVERTMIFPPMPRLEGDNPLFEKYRTAKKTFHNYPTYSKILNHAFDERISSKQDLKGEENSKPVESPSFKHWLTHEAESTLWVITSWLTHVIPVPNASTTQAASHPAPDPEGYISSDAYHQICSLLYLDPPESRDLIPAASEWRKFLHPHLAPSLATMLAEMHRYLQPEWALLPMTDMRSDHAHEALRRIVFKEIVRMKDAGEVGEVQRARRAVPLDIKEEFGRRAEHAEFMAIFGKSVNPLGRFMGARLIPMPGHSHEGSGYEVSSYPGDEDDEGEEDMDQDQETPKATPSSLPNGEATRSQAPVGKEDEMDTD